MNANRSFGPAFIRVLGLVLLVANVRADGDAISFNRDIRPILSKNCFACHGFDEKERKGKLRLDTAEGASQAITPGNPSGSEVWLRLTSDDEDEVMPPPDSHKSLTANEKQTIKKWIEQGARYEAHWSFLPPVKPPVPQLEGATTVANPIDAFLQERLAKLNIKPAELAPKDTLIRRVTLDLTGLPPTAPEVAAFVADASPDAYSRLVDDLLKRPTHGEHMARYWLDLARYADTHGLHLDNERTMWPYRDWVVRAFNQNLPFDQFTRWQLAGDLLEKPDREQLIASGFNRCNVTTSEGGSIDAEWVYRYAVDRTSTAMEVWMGLTGGCAVCHDHKFDPLSTREYYSLYSFFHSAADPAMDGNKVDTPPILRLTKPEDEARIAELDKKIAAIDAKISTAIAAIQYTDPATLTPPPPPAKQETVWFEDVFPPGAKPEASGGAPLQLIKKGDGEIYSGNQSLRRTAKDTVAQDFYAGGPSFVVPKNGEIFAHCFLDPVDPPQAVMVQFHVGGWKHRAIWGDQEKIDFGKPGTTEKVAMGALPKTGEWVRLAFDATKLGLKAGTKVDGFAFTQYSGTVTWDRLGVAATTDPAKDSTWSWQVWKKENQGKRNEALPDGLRELVRAKKPETWTSEEAEKVYKHWLANFYAGARDALSPLDLEKAPFLAEKTAIEKATPITFVMADMPKPRESFVMLRGAYDAPGEKVSRGVPSFLPPLPEKSADRDYNRLDLANWLVSGTHPLTSRVAVNRLWQQFFGTGLVETSGDFGSQGTPPSHPELLEWLAVQFVEDGWDIRQFVKRIVMSHAYRQSSKTSPELIELDPGNRLLARSPRIRLDAEVLRDQALAVSGLLVPEIGGKGVNPYQPPNIWEPVGFGNSNTRYYKQGTGKDLYRRSLYTFFKRTAPPPFMSTFDAPNREQSCTIRGRSNTPLQALQLMNDFQHVEAARNLAQRILKEGGATADERIKWAWQVVTSRWPEADELQVARNSLEQHHNRYRSDEVAAKELISYGESKADPSCSPAELAAYTLLANLILNLDETVSKN